MANNLGSYPSTAPDHPLDMSCVYALSGTYGFLPRLLFYVTLVFAIFGRRSEWLVIGALVSALTYAGTTAIHVIALSGSKKDIFDLDIIGGWAVLSTGALAYVCMMHWSNTLRLSRARGVMIAWGILVGTALIFGRVELFDNNLAAPEPACYSSTGDLLLYPIQLDNTFNCTYQCFSYTKPMRQASEVMAIPYSVLVNRYWSFTYALVGPIQFAAYAALSMDAGAHTPSQGCTYLVMKFLDPKHNDNLVRTIYNASHETWYGGYIALLTYIFRAKWSLRILFIYVLLIPWLTLGLLVDIFSLPMLVINIVLNEIMIMATDLPTNEANYAIGQWGPIVSSVLVVIAAVYNRVIEEYERRKHLRKQMAQTQRPSVASSVTVVDFGEVELGNTAEQTTGIVKPNLAHVETLRDLSDYDKRSKQWPSH